MIQEDWKSITVVETDFCLSRAAEAPDEFLQCPHAVPSDRYFSGDFGHTTACFVNPAFNVDERVGDFHV